MLDKARDGGYAVGAFNAENAEMVFAIVAAAEKCKAPVILQMAPSTLRYLPPACFAGIAAAAAQNATVPVALHLDHGDSLDLVKECLDAGYTSVMFDGSRLPFDENAALTAEAVRLARDYGASCEGELGTVGGKEDLLEAQAGAYTDPDQAAAFVRTSGVDSLAVAVGDCPWRLPDGTKAGFGTDSADPGQSGSAAGFTRRFRVTGRCGAGGGSQGNGQGEFLPQSCGRPLPGR